MFQNQKPYFRIFRFMSKLSMNTALINIIIANVLISLISLIGGFSILSKKIFSKNNIHYMVAFAAGVILTTVFFDLLPEALHSSEEIGFKGNILAPAFFGLLMSFFIERFVIWFHHHESTHGLKPTIFLITIGDLIHNFVDGLTIAGTFLANPYLGIITTVAIAAHELPQEISDLGIYFNSGLTRNKALILNFLTAITAVAGGIIGYYFLTYIKFGLPIVLSFSSGIFIYIAGSDLIPGLHKHFNKQKKWAQTIPFILGIIIMYLLIYFLHH